MFTSRIMDAHFRRYGLDTLRSSKRMVSVTLPPRFKFLHYQSHRAIYSDSKMYEYFDLGMSYDGIDRHYYGRHNLIDNSTVVYDIFNRLKYEYTNSEYQNLEYFHQHYLKRYYMNLIEFYVFGRKEFPIKEG